MANAVNYSRLFSPPCRHVQPDRPIVPRAGVVPAVGSDGLGACCTARGDHPLNRARGKNTSGLIWPQAALRLRLAHGPSRYIQQKEPALLEGRATDVGGESFLSPRLLANLAMPTYGSPWRTLCSTV
jgi:hypothetical protein